MNHAFLRASFLTCSAILAFGQSLPSVSFQATAQTIAGSTLYLTGNVHIGNAKCSIEADEVDYNVTTGEAQARGNVQVKMDQGPPIRGDMVKGSLVGIYQWQVKGVKQ